MSDVENLEQCVKKLFNILNKKMIKRDSELQNQISTLITDSDLNPKYKYICTEIIKNL